MAKATEVRERPILFSPPMVRAILDGRKVMTRRIVKLRQQQPTPEYRLSPCHYSGGWSWDSDSGGCKCKLAARCPYGWPGERLWVKEGWRPRIAHSHGQDACDCADVIVRYLADGSERFVNEREIPHDWLMPKAAANGGVTSLYMPRWASRITLEIENIRVERVNLITADDVVAEGIDPSEVPGIGSDSSFVKAFAQLWDSVNGAGAWERNDWVWCVSFRRVEK